MIDIFISFLRYHMRYHRHEHRDRDLLVWLVINDTAIFLRPRQKEFIMRQIHIDQTDTLSIRATDKDGNIVSPLVFDDHPVWANTDDSAATLTVAPNGQTAILNPTRVDGVTTVSVQAIISGVVFQASADYTVISGNVAAIEIVDTFAPKPE